VEELARLEGAQPLQPFFGGPRGLGLARSLGGQLAAAPWAVEAARRQQPGEVGSSARESRSAGSS
jgi:hypothetical protein